MRRTRTPTARARTRTPGARSRSTSRSRPQTPIPTRHWRRSSPTTAEEDAMGELGDKLRAAVEPALEAGEQLRGVCVATQQSMFKGRQVAIATTDRRLVVQGMT